MKFPNKDEITQMIIKDIIGSEKPIDSLNGNWFIKTLVIALRESIWVVINICMKIWDGLTVITASGTDLNLRGEEVGIGRKPAIKAQHSVTIGKSKPVATDTYVPDNFLVTTTPVGNNFPIKFIVIPNQNKFIKKGYQTVSDVLVECVEYGAVGNVSENSINLIAQAGFDTCSNSLVAIYGNDSESDKSYRENILRRKQIPSRSGTKQDWETWTKKAPGIGAAIVYPCGNGNGTIDIVILDEYFNFPTLKLIEDTQKFLDEQYLPADLWRQDKSAITVSSPEKLLIDIEIKNCIFKAGYDINQNTNTISILKNTLDELLKANYESSIIRKNDIIVSLKLAYDDKSGSNEPIFEDFELTKPEKNILIQDRHKASIGKIDII